MKSDGLVELLSPITDQFGIDLEEVDVTPAGKRRLVRVVVDGDGPAGHGLLLDDIAEATRAISTALDESDLMGSGAYTLEVSSRGVGRPLTLPRHWRRNRGRLVQVSLNDSSDRAEDEVGPSAGAPGLTLLGRIVESDEDSVLLRIEETDRRVAFRVIDQALVQIELNRKTEAEIDGDTEGVED